MIEGASNNLANLTGVKSALGGQSTAAAGGGNFADALKKSIDEVSRLQQDASKAIDDVATGKSEDVTGVMTAVEKSDLAFKTLLSIRSKLLDAYDEIKGMSV
jgi:flagellar hook-basal body complex protein FliE